MSIRSVIAMLCVPSKLQRFKGFHEPRVRTFCGLSQWLVTSTPETIEEEKLERIKTARESHSLKFRQFPIHEFRIAGVSFEKRQSVLKRAKWGEAIICEREPHNQFDPNAVRISLLDGSSLGYVPREWTNYFRQSSTAGRLKSIGLGEGGYHGAIACVQPQLPCLLPISFPAELQFFSKLFDGFSDDDRVRILEFLKSKQKNECHFTGLRNELIPQVSWRVHFDQKIYQISEVCLMSKDLVSVYSMPDGVSTLAAANRWTENEALIYTQRWTDKQSGILDSDWSVDLDVLKSLLDELQIDLPMKLQDYLSTRQSVANEQ